MDPFVILSGLRASITMMITLFFCIAISLQCGHESLTWGNLPEPEQGLDVCLSGRQVETSTTPELIRCVVQTPDMYNLTWFE